MEKTVRLYRPEDCKEIVKLFYDAVHAVNLKDYSSAQLDAWAPEEIDIDTWKESLSKSHTVVVESNGVIVGSGNLDDTGYFDRLYVDKDFQGQGVATAIANELEKYARQKGITIVTADASITARPFFEKHRYKVIKQQRVKCRGQTLTNFVMKKHISK